MSRQPDPGGRFDPPPTTYIRPSKLAKILGWSRTNVHYWLLRCGVELVDIAGYKLVPVYQLPALVMMLQKAKEDAHAAKESRERIRD